MVVLVDEDIATRIPRTRRDEALLRNEGPGLGSARSRTTCAWARAGAARIACVESLGAPVRPLQRDASDAPMRGSIKETTMANITVRNDQQKPAITRPSTWHPFRSLRDLLAWDPFQEMAPVLGSGTLEFSPSFDIKETKDKYLFTADLPGIKSSDVDVSISGNRLSISGKRESEKEEKGETYYACERSYGSFMRAFTLPEGANTEALTADLKDGVLTISVAKKPEMQAKKIPVGTQAAKH
jgi:HSP20 family protein